MNDSDSDLDIFVHRDIFYKKEEGVEKNETCEMTKIGNIMQFVKVDINRTIIRCLKLWNQPLD